MPHALDVYSQHECSASAINYLNKTLNYTGICLLNRKHIMQSLSATALGKIGQVISLLPDSDAHKFFNQ
jgi:hypothetical protein